MNRKKKREEKKRIRLKTSLLLESFLFGEAKSNNSTKAGAGILFRTEDTGKVLLLKRSPSSSKPNTWGLPGGKIDNEEEMSNPKTAAKREAFEEVGYTGNFPLKLIYTSKRPGFRFYNFLSVIPKEFAVQLNDEHSEYGWFATTNLPSPLHPGVAELFRAAKV